MKKTLFMMMLMLGIAATLTSCKKEEDPTKTEKEKTIELLVTGKWYYQSYKTTGASSGNTCFNGTHYWEFKADGTFDETYNFSAGTYTVSEDGKTVTAKIAQNIITITVGALTSNNFDFKLVFLGSSSDIMLSKTALNCVIKK